MFAQVLAKSNKSIKILTNQKCLWVHSQEQSYFLYKKFSWFDFCFEYAMWNFNQGKLLTTKTSNGKKHLMENPIFKLPHHQRIFNN